MGQAEIILFLVFTSIILIILITGIILFVLKYRSRKIQHDHEVKTIGEQHKIDIVNTELSMRQQTMEYIGKEIHDSVAQKLTLASIYSHKLEQKNDDNKNVSKLINEALAELRQLSRTLVDNKFQSESLNELIYKECERINALNVCQVTLLGQSEPNLDITIKGSVFRIIQEFIQNSIKHAHCKEITITVGQTERELHVTLADDGTGFDTSTLKHKGIGLDNMRSRTLKMGGTFTLDSDQQHGTVLHISVPLAN